VGLIQPPSSQAQIGIERNLTEWLVISLDQARQGGAGAGGLMDQVEVTPLAWDCSIISSKVRGGLRISAGNP
jgi:hypothetical protein